MWGQQPAARPASLHSAPAPRAVPPHEAIQGAVQAGLSCTACNLLGCVLAGSGLTVRSTRQACRALALAAQLCQLAKRFLLSSCWISQQVSWHEQQKRPVCQKLHTSVEMPETVQLGSYLAVAAQPPLPGGQLQLHAPGKENEQQHVNTAPNSQEAGPASQEATPLEVYPKTRPGSQNHGDISGGGISGGNRITAVASHALVHSTPRPGAAAATPFLKRRLPGTPGAGAVFRPLRR